MVPGFIKVKIGFLLKDDMNKKARSFGVSLNACVYFFNCAFFNLHVMMWPIDLLSLLSDWKYAKWNLK